MKRTSKERGGGTRRIRPRLRLAGMADDGEQDTEQVGRTPRIVEVWANLGAE
ncbi:MAG: hypothetical protein JW751_11100 [Polyangiaceae bacterium]|nr:hypothetical protein [Polyangiaceae bacterium]